MDNVSHSVYIGTYKSLSASNTIESSVLLKANPI